MAECAGPTYAPGRTYSAGDDVRREPLPASGGGGTFCSAWSSGGTFDVVAVAARSAAVQGNRRLAAVTCCSASVALMKQLLADDLRSFEQQWRLHCAYCDGAYDQVGFPDLELQIHDCWHRFYVYFHERILGKLIGDDTFVLPFWNWDAPGGMTLPAIYANRSSPLYDDRHDSCEVLLRQLEVDDAGVVRRAAVGVRDPATAPGGQALPPPSKAEQTSRRRPSGKRFPPASTTYSVHTWGPAPFRRRDELPAFLTGGMCGPPPAPAGGVTCRFSTLPPGYF